MRYEKALPFLKKEYPLLGKWIEKTVGTLEKYDQKVNADLLVVGVFEEDRLKLIQGAILIWVASGRPQNKDKWGTAAQTKKMFIDMSSGALQAYLKENDYAEEAPVPSHVAVQPSIPQVSVPLVSIPQVSIPQVSFQPIQPHTQSGPPLPPRTPGLHNAYIAQRANANASPSPVVRNQPSVHTHAPASNLGSGIIMAPGLGLGGGPSSTPQQPQVNLAPPPPKPRAKPKTPVNTPAVTPFKAHKADDLIKKIEAMSDLKRLFICDVPIAHKVYLTEKMTGSFADQAKIGLDKADPETWIKYGKKVISNGLAKCHGCAAAVIYMLVRDSSFDDVRIESIGAEGPDHHFVVINRDPNTNVQDQSTWNKEAVWVDAWQANLTEWEKTTPATIKKTNVCYTYSVFPYAQFAITLFCALEPGNRAKYREGIESYKMIPNQTMQSAWGPLKKCYLEHFGQNKKVSSCPITGWCNVNAT